jgi:hypothetical protein
MNVFLFSDILIMMFSFANYSFFFKAVLKMISKLFNLLIYRIRELDQEIKDMIQIEYV